MLGKLAIVASLLLVTHDQVEHLWLASMRRSCLLLLINGKASIVLLHVRRDDTLDLLIVLLLQSVELVMLK